MIIFQSLSSSTELSRNWLLYLLHPSKAGMEQTLIHYLSCSDFHPPLFSVFIDTPAKYAAYSIIRLIIILWGESSCQRGPLEPAYCVFCWGSRGAECCTWLYFYYFTGTGWSLALVSMTGSVYWSLFIPSSLAHSHTNIWRQRRVCWMWSGEKETSTWHSGSCWPGLDDSVANAHCCVCLLQQLTETQDCRPFSPSLYFNQLVILSKKGYLYIIHLQ